MVAISKAVEVKVEALPKWLKDETESVLQPLNEKYKVIWDRVQERFEDFRENCERLAEEGNKEAERGRAKRKARVTQKLTKFFMKQIRQITFPDQTSFSEIRRFQGTLEGALSLILRERNSWFPRISPLFIIARRRVDFALSKLAKSISELRNFIEDEFSKAKDVEDLLVLSDELLRHLEDQKHLVEREKSVKAKVATIEKKLRDCEQKIASITDHSEVQAHEMIEERTEELRTRMKQEFRHLQKPLTKLSNLWRDSSHYLNSEEKEKLEKYLEDPYHALATEEEGYPILKKILRGLKQSTDDGRLKLKSSRLRKALEKINTILERGGFDTFYGQCVAILSESEEIKMSEEVQMAQMSFRQLQKATDECRRRINANKAKLDPTKKRRTRIQEKIGETKREIRKLTSTILQKEITITP